MSIAVSYHMAVFATQGTCSEFIKVTVNNKHLRDLTGLYRVDVPDMHNLLSRFFLSQWMESWEIYKNS